MFEGSNAMQRKAWAPYFGALEQVVDAIASTSLDAQLEHRLMNTPNLWRDFAALFRQRHPTVWEAFEAANLTRCRAASEAKKRRSQAARPRQAQRDPCPQKGRQGSAATATLITPGRRRANSGAHLHHQAGHERRKKL